MNNKVRSNSPLVLNITNLVTINDIANVLTMIGASPMMTGSIDEIEELMNVVKACNGALVVNIGTIDTKQIELIYAGVKTANKIGVKVVLDPVGAGASKLRTNTAKRILETCKIDVVRGNYNEISALLDIDIESCGVDSINGSDETIALQFAQRYHTVVLISGKVDYLSDGQSIKCISGGSAYLPQITGTGCMLSAICGAYIATFDDTLAATKAALLHVLKASEQAELESTSIIEFKQNWFKYMELISYE